MKVKSLAPETEEKKSPKPDNKIKPQTDPAELEIDISESEPNAVEKKAGMVSHKSIKRKKGGQEKSKQLPSKVGKNLESEIKELTSEAEASLAENLHASPEVAKPKPFLLDLKYLDHEDQETVKATDSQESLSADMVDRMIARLNDLQDDLEKQLISMPGELIPKENSENGSSEQKADLLDELDSFLFTATQRKKTE